MDVSRPINEAGESLGSLGEPDSGAPSRAEIEAAMEAILVSRDFATSPRQQSLLRHLVSETLEGRSERLKEFSIAVDVFNRAETFDPRVDSIVRVQASRLRGQLAAYYKRTSAGVTVRIDLPAGGYTPTFSRIAEGASRPATAGPSQAAKEAAGSEPPVPASARPPQTPTQPPRDGRLPWIMPALLVAASLVLVALIALAVTAPRPEPRPAPSSRPDGPTIFVARYQLIDGNESTSVLRDGLQFDLIDSLSRFEELNVLGIDTVFGSTIDAARTNPYGADFIVSGSIQLEGDRLRVTSQLQGASDNRVMWSEVYNGTLSDVSSVLEVQEKIAGDVAGQLGQPNGVIQERLKEELTEDRAISMEDYLCVLASYEYSRVKSRERHAEVRACLEEVTLRSPRYAPAWAKLSWMYGDETRYRYNPRPDDLPAHVRSRMAAERAVSANSSAAIAHQYLALALFLEGDTAGARRSIERALELNPNNAEILADAAQILVETDELERGRDLGERAIALNPGHPAWYNQALAIYHIVKANRSEALQFARAAAPDGSPAATYILAAALRLNRMEDEADQALRDLAARIPSAITDPARLPEMEASMELPPEVMSRIFRK